MNLFELDQSTDLDNREEDIRKKENVLSQFDLLSYRQQITKNSNYFGYFFFISSVKCINLLN